MDSEARFNDVKRIISYECDDVPSEVVERAMITAMRSIAKTTGALCTKLVLTELQDGVAEYDFSYAVPQGYQVQKIKWVMLCGCKLRVVDECDPCPIGFEVLTKTCIKLHPCPNNISPGDVELSVEVRPDYDVCELPDDLIENEEMLIDGAIATLASQYKKPWGDPQLARLKRRDFMSHMVDYKGRARQDFTEEKECRMQHGFV